MKKYILAVGASLLPVVAFAAAGDPTVGDVETGLTGALRSLTGIVNAVVPFLLAIAVVIFIYGVIKYVFQSDAEGKAEARSYIIWGIVGIAVILAVLGLARLLLSAVGVEGGDTTTSDDYPTVDTTSAGADNSD